MDERSQHRMSLKPLQAHAKIAKRQEGDLSAATFGPPDQGLRLGRAFASIRDPAVREAIVDLVEAMSKRSS